MILRLAAAGFAIAAAIGSAEAQRWSELQGRTKSGEVALAQAIADAGSDALVMLVASHPDDRYVLPAVYLRYRYGARIAVLLASRGGGGQNSLGPETGDALEQIRTLEAEAGCSRFDGQVYYLNRPDRGFRRTAAETYAEWGRDETLASLTRIIRLVGPDVIVTTHNAEETHGHDLALAELLPLAVARAADEGNAAEAPHRVHALFLGATSTPLPGDVVLDAESFDPLHGASYRRLAHEILVQHHLSPGLPSPMDTVFAAHPSFRPLPIGDRETPRDLLDGVQDLFAAGVYPGTTAEAEALRKTLVGLSGFRLDREQLVTHAVAAARALSALSCPPASDAERRRQRRLAAVQQIVQHGNAIAIELEPRPGAVAVPGEELDLDVRIHVGGPFAVDGVRATAIRGDATLEPVEGDSTAIEHGGLLRAVLQFRVPLEEGADAGARDRRFRSDRYEPPITVMFHVAVAGIEVPIAVTAPIELRPPVQLSVVPRMLLLPATSAHLRFAVRVERNSAFPVKRDLEVRCPAGYRVEGPRTHIDLTSIRRDVFEFALSAPVDRRSGVDIVRIALGGQTIDLPVHKVDVQMDAALHIGVVRSLDDALVSAIGAGGFGCQWADLGDSDLAVGDLSRFDTIVVDVRALRDRPEARQSFRRLLEFSSTAGRRLVVLYHKDVEFQPPGEGFVGAPIQPFQVGRSRVTRADAPVHVLRPDHLLLRQPNTIRPGDWDGWEQERALYLPAVYADAYEELLEMADPGLPPERSAVLYAKNGDGEYVYCALALWRQLKKLHPGAVRFLANLLTPARAKG